MGICLFSYLSPLILCHPYLSLPYCFLVCPVLLFSPPSKTISCIPSISRSSSSQTHYRLVSYSLLLTFSPLSSSVHILLSSFSLSLPFLYFSSSPHMPSSFAPQLLSPHHTTMLFLVLPCVSSSPHILPHMLHIFPQQTSYSFPLHPSFVPIHTCPIVPLLLSYTLLSFHYHSTFQPSSQMLLHPDPFFSLLSISSTH